MGVAGETRGTLGARIVLQGAKSPENEDSRPGQGGNRGGGGYEIRTREGVNPTRFPSERHRPLGESSVEDDTGSGLAEPNGHGQPPGPSRRANTGVDLARTGLFRRVTGRHARPVAGGVLG